MLNYILNLFRPKFGARSPSWRKVRKEFIKECDRCEVCETKKRLEVHHIKPYHLFPELELELTNLITLCRRCHLLFGHLDNWRNFNNEVIEDANYWNNKLKK